MTLTAIQAYVLKELQKGKEIDTKMIKMLVDDFSPVAGSKKALYDRYTINKVPILDRPIIDGTKVNNKLNNDFAGEIVDQKVGYVLGSAIKYSLDKNAYGETAEELFKEHQGKVNRFIVGNTMNDKDIELGKLISICGVAGREIYIDKDGEEKIANLPAWEMIYLTDADGQTLYALRLHYELRSVGEDLVETLCVDFYDNTKITFFVEHESDQGIAFKLDEEAEINPLSHVFGFTPIVKVVNNEEEMGDFERVLNLIDGYDRTMSDVNSEIEQFRMAYMYFKGVKVTTETIEKAKTAGGFEIPADGDIGFITKQMSDGYVENHLKHLEENINRFAKHVNMSDPNFGGGDSSLANKYKLSAMEMKAMMLEVKMKSALLKQFKILTSAWNKKGIEIDYLNVFFSFNRNLPVNVIEEADENVKLKGLVSERTRLARLSFVDDVDYELEQMLEDNERDGLTLAPEDSVEERTTLDLNSFDEEEEVDVDEETK